MTLLKCSLSICKLFPYNSVPIHFKSRRELEEQKARLEDQRARLEAELREQFRRDITALRDEMAEVNRKNSPPPQPPQPAQQTAVKRRDSGEMIRQMEVMKDALKADFEEQIKVLQFSQ